jgi:dihydrofolate reductase
MREIVLGVGISLDGYIARPNGAVDFLFMPKDYPMAAFFATIDTAVMGRKTYEVASQMGRGSFGVSNDGELCLLQHAAPWPTRQGHIYSPAPSSFRRRTSQKARRQRLAHGRR